MTRPRDLSFEALAEVTGTDWAIGRGELNEALSGIRSQMQDVDDAELATEIVYRAKCYRQVFQGATLTPSALNKHWVRVYEEANRQRDAQATNQSAPVVHCSTCHGVRFVVYARRPMEDTAHLKILRRLPHKREPRGTEFPSPLGVTLEPSVDMIEEYAACPECSTDVDVTFRRADGSMFRAPDPASVRERL